ncbi:MAG: D-2-hydroxyacid dehydrogenase [Gemmatimonadota bacterium]|nr:D-2-hydroxyacid dehydrogenase [Gemmatimonadota bacterium]MDH5758368.1 D-2-hydroxyacid dehydrogenase [Gemmatimonadota bacterium]
MPGIVLDMMDRRPIWAMPGWVPERIRESLPAGWKLVVMDEETDGSGDGAARISSRVLDAVAAAEIYLGYGIPAELLRAAPGLKWAHSGAAGVGSSLTPEMMAHPVLFTNSAGIHAPPMAETVLGMMLHFGRGLDFALANQRLGRWSTEPYYVAGAPIRELSRCTIGIVGFGGIGREIARRVAALGARVVAVQRSVPREGEADLAPVEGGGSLGDRIELVHGAAGVDAVLRESDYVVLAVPETDETRGMIGADALDAMKPEAVLINVGRGRLVDEDALVSALEAGSIRGAGLDVFATEPLPEGHPLWRLPNVLITPHVSAVTRAFWERETELILDNLERYVQGEPLRNLVDKTAGY